MTLLDAAFAVLDARRLPLTAREIASEAERAGLLQTAGQTPAATMTACLYLRDHPDGRLVRLAEPGPTRARRGSVRWALRVSEQSP